MGWFPCDCQDCVDLCEDDFNRTAGTDIDTGSSCGWTEVNGDWEIVSATPNNRLRSNGSGIATCDTTNGATAADNSFWLRVKVSGDTENDTARILCNYEDTDNYDYAEIKFHDGTSAEIRLVERDSGSETELANLALDAVTADLASQHDVELCAEDGVLKLSIRRAGSVFWLGITGVATATNGVVALASTGSGDIEFDDFIFREHISDNSACPDCTDTPCEGCSDTMPESVQIDIAGATSPCSINGTFVLDQVATTVFESDQTCAWRYTAGSGVTLINAFITYVLLTQKWNLRVEVSTLGLDAIFSHIQTLQNDKYECQDFSSFNVPLSAAFGSCAGKTPTCAITAL